MRAFAILLALSLTACSTVTHGPMQRISVDSNPPGATVTGENCGTPRKIDTATPATVWVSRRAKRCTFTLSHPDYPAAQSVRLTRQVADRFKENTRAFDGTCDAFGGCDDRGDVISAVFIGGIVTGTGMGIDAITGAMYHQDPPEVWVDFTYQKP